MLLLAYLNYCQPGQRFYQPLTARDPQDRFDLHRAPAPDGWTRTERQEWVDYAPDANPLRRTQGWKIHVSGTPGNAADLLDAVARHCFAHQVRFKALGGPGLVSWRSGKYAERGASGKFITVYPTDDDEFATLLHDLDALVGGADGPYILSDLRWGAGPLYVRYGAFVSRQVRHENGSVMECIEDPDGNLVEDQRRPGFHPPEWAPVPAVLAPALEARSAGRLTRFPYRVVKPLHYSNGGGVYLAERTDDGRPILLKEARPFCGLDEQAQDAVARLERERQALADLAGIPGVPALDDHVVGVEHRFLGREYVAGTSLTELMLDLNPLVNPASRMSREQYAAWACGRVADTVRVVRAIHAAGYVFGDLHPGNLVIDDEGGVHVIDLESASRDQAGLRQPMGAFGYRAPEGYRGVAVDDYALGCLRLGVLMPLTRALALGPQAAAVLVERARAEFPLPADYFDPLPAELGWPDLRVADPPDRADARRLAALVDGPFLAGALHAEATGDDTRRLFPGDILQFVRPGGGASFATGAAGVIWSLRACGEPVEPGYLRWLRHAVDSTPELPVGFWDGLAGIAFAVDGLDDALAGRCARAASAGARELRDVSMSRGITGLALYLLDRAGRPHGGPQDVEAADELGRRLLELGPAHTLAAGPGLVHGASGAALLADRLAAVTGDAAYHRFAAEVLHQEVVRYGLTTTRGPERVTLPVHGAGLGSGALGVGLALHEHRRAGTVSGEGSGELGEFGGEFGAEFARAAAVADALAVTPVVLNGGVLSGRCGMVQYLLAVHGPAAGEQARRHRDLLLLNASLTPGGLDCLGDEGMRLSLDYATGLSGVATTLHACRREAPVLPLLALQR